MDFTDLDTQIMEKHHVLENFGVLMGSATRYTEVSQPSSTTWCQKSAPNASELMRLGDAAFCSENFEEAGTLYNESVATAPIDSPELALAFGNRASVWFKCSKFESCLLDLNRALSGRCSENNRARLLERKNVCWLKLQLDNESKMPTQNSLMPNDVPTLVDRQVRFVSKINKDDTDAVIDYSPLIDPIWNTMFHNSCLPNVSSKMKIEEGYFVATDNIDPGEVLSIQYSYALKTFDTTRLNYCAYCTVRFHALIPCFTCNQEMYCSERCRQEAYDAYHRTECMILPFIDCFAEPEKTKLFLLPLRMFLIGTKQGSELITLMYDPKVYYAIDGKLSFDSVQHSTNEYLSILSAQWKTSNELYPDSINQLRFAQVVQICLILERIGFYDRIKPDSESTGFSTTLELFVALLVLHHLSLVLRYSYSSNVTLMRSDSFEIDAIGRGITTLQPLVRHSCDANTALLQERRLLLIYCLKPIKAGEQISVSYDEYHYGSFNLQERKLELRDFHNIECECSACIGNWPTAENILKRRNKYLTSNKEHIETIKGWHQWLMLKVSQGLFAYNEEHMKKIFQFIKWVFEYVRQPSPSVLLSTEFIRNCMRMKGNFYVLSSLDSVLLQNSQHRE